MVIKTASMAVMKPTASTASTSSDARFSSAWTTRQHPHSVLADLESVMMLSIVPMKKMRRIAIGM